MSSMRVDSSDDKLFSWYFESIKEVLENKRGNDDFDVYNDFMMNLDLADKADVNIPKLATKLLCQPFVVSTIIKQVLKTTCSQHVHVPSVEETSSSSDANLKPDDATITLEMRTNALAADAPVELDDLDHPVKRTHGANDTPRSIADDSETLDEVSKADQASSQLRFVLRLQGGDVEVSGEGSSTGFTVEGDAS
ncbi:MAG: hypothetical protein COA94_05330 [Rickettsiales bacterium]|nr:MAG: hypothetical protein COA94_05330 [Rickettsiales bacterium]